MARRGARGRCGLSGQDEPAGPSLNPAAIVASLNQHQVRYVVIGAFAAIAQQAPIPATRDIDVTPEASRENLARLSQALIDLGARIRTEAVAESGRLACCGFPVRADVRRPGDGDGPGARPRLPADPRVKPSAAKSLSDCRPELPP